MNNLRNGLRALAYTLLASAIPSGLAYAGDRHDDDSHHGDRDFRIEVLSSRPYMVSGGDALVRVTVKDKDVSLRKVRIELNGTNITGTFVANASARTLTGLVTGLRLGRNQLEVDAKGKGRGRADADITLTNYRIQGPIISGPQEFPFACTTQNFVPFPGSPALGAPLDSDCSIERRVQYVYRTTRQHVRVASPAVLEPAGQSRLYHHGNRRHGAVHRSARDGNDQPRDLPDRDPA